MSGVSQCYVQHPAHLPEKKTASGLGSMSFRKYLKKEDQSFALQKSGKLQISDWCCSKYLAFKLSQAESIGQLFLRIGRAITFYVFAERYMYIFSCIVLFSCNN